MDRFVRFSELNNAIDKEISKNVQLPYNSALVEDFDFSDLTTMTLNGSKIASIMGQMGTVSSQGNATYQPTYENSGGPNNLPWANFNTSGLSGPGILTGTDFAIFVVRRCDSTNLSGIFYDGDINSGYALADNQVNSGVTSPGMYFMGVSQIESVGQPSIEAKWEIFCGSHSSGKPRFYNGAGFSLTLREPTDDPITPGTSAHGIGELPGASLYIGGIARILIYNVQLTDPETRQILNYLNAKYLPGRPFQLATGGDSITQGFGLTDTSTYPYLLLNDLIGENYNLFVNQTGVSGRKTADVLTGLNTEVLYKVLPNAPNIYTLMIGHNDIAADEDATTIYNNIVSICQQAKNVGYTVLIMTILNSTVDTGSRATVRDAVNNDIRTNYLTFADYLLDANVITELVDPTNTTYFQDGIHLTSTGTPILASHLNTLIQTIINSLLA